MPLDCLPFSGTRLPGIRPRPRRDQRSLDVNAAMFDLFHFVSPISESLAAALSGKSGHRWDDVERRTWERVVVMAVFLTLVGSGFAIYWFRHDRQQLLDLSRILVLVWFLASAVFGFVLRVFTGESPRNGSTVLVLSRRPRA